MRSNIFSFLLVAALGCGLASGAEPHIIVRPGDSGEVLGLTTRSSII